MGLAASLNAQSVFNDTILFKITRIKPTGQNFRYLMEFTSYDDNGIADKTGQIVLNMCGCYCDSLWDAWPTEANGTMTGGGATIDYISSNSSAGSLGIGAGVPRPQRGRLNIWQMPGSFLRTEPFSLPVMLRFDP